MFEPKTFYINKTFYIFENYTKLFAGRAMLLSTHEENILFFTIYPKWTYPRINIDEIRTNFFNKTPYIHSDLI